MRRLGGETSGGVRCLEGETHKRVRHLVVGETYERVRPERVRPERVRPERVRPLGVRHLVGETTGD